MRIVLIVIGLLVWWIGSVEAACSGPTVEGDGVTTRTAAAVSTTEINLCVTASASGDRIRVPEGSGTINVSLPSSKDLDIIGATVVTCSGTPGTSGYSCSAGGTTTTVTGSPAFTIDLAASHTISGFVITGGAGERVSSTGEQNVNKHFRIHHNSLISTAGWQPIRFRGGSNGIHPQGIWDHNRFQDGVAIHTNGTLDQLNEGDVQHAIWAEESPLGDSSKVIYLEANYFTNSANTTNYGDGNYGGRSVIRFNTTSGGAIVAWEYHSPQGDNRGYQRWENYKNHHINLDIHDGCFFGMHSLRGGTGVVFDNAMTGATSGCNNKISMDNVRSADNVAVFGLCDGTRTGIDQNTGGQLGWHCRDQIGISHDLSQWDHLPTPLSWNQNLKPAYLWNNTEGASNAPVTVDTAGNNLTHIIANRDFYDYSTATGSPQTVGVRQGTIANRPANCTTGVAYWATDEGEWNSDNPGVDGRLYKCTATNTWTLYYTPYTYPHPWTGASQSTPPARFSPVFLRAEVQP